MAYKNSAIYPDGIETPDANFPEGKPKDATSDTSADGWPYDQRKQSDIEALLQSLLVRNGVAPNGAGDTVLASQYVDSLFNLTGKVFNTAADLNDIDSLRRGDLVRIKGLNDVNDGISRTYRIELANLVSTKLEDLVLTGASSNFIAVYISEQSSLYNYEPVSLSVLFTMAPLRTLKASYRNGFINFNGGGVVYSDDQFGPPNGLLFFLPINDLSHVPQGVRGLTATRIRAGVETLVPVELRTGLGVYLAEGDAVLGDEYYLCGGSIPYDPDFV